MAEKNLPRNVVVIRSLFDWSHNHPFKFFGIFVLIILLISLFFVPFEINLQQLGVIRRFGRYIGHVDRPGLNFKVPWGIDHLTKVEARTVYDLQLISEKRKDGKSALEYFSGDENLIDVSCIIQYQITNPANYLFQMAKPREILLSLLKEALVTEMSRRSLAEIISINKGIIQDAIQDSLNRDEQIYQMGIELVSVNLDDLQPPQESLPSFMDVIDAKEDKEQVINQAQAYKENVVAEASGFAARLVDGAKAFAATAILQAHGDAERFQFLLAQKKSAPQGTRVTEYYRTINPILSQAAIYVLRPHQGAHIEVNLLDHILPELPKFEKILAEKGKHQERTPGMGGLQQKEGQVDRMPGTGGHREPGGQIEHVELPTTTKPIPASELKEAPYE